MKYNTFFQVLQVMSLRLDKQTSKNVADANFNVFIIAVNNLLFTRPFQFENAPSESLFLQLADHIQDSLALKVIECFFPQMLMHLTVSKI